MVRLGIAGLGRWGRTLLESVQNRSEDVRFVTAATGTPAKAADYARRWGVALVGSVEELAQCAEIDGIVLATPHSQHLQQLLAGFAAGKHMFVEKPMVLTRRQAEAALRAAQDADRVLAVGFNRRFLPSTRRLKQMIEDGSLGTLQAAEANFSGGSGFRYQPGMWRADPKESPAGGMTGLGIHLIDILIHFCGPIARVATRSCWRVTPIPVDDSTQVAIDFASGAMGTLTTLTTTADLWHVRVLGSGGWVEMRGYDRLIFSARGGDTIETAYPRFDMERAELEAFAAAIRGKEAYPVSLDEALHGVAAFEAIVASAATASFIEV